MLDCMRDRLMPARMGSGVGPGSTIGSCPVAPCRPGGRPRAGVGATRLGWFRCVDRGLVAQGRVLPVGCRAFPGLGWGWSWRPRGRGATAGLPPVTGRGCAAAGWHGGQHRRRLQQPGARGKPANKGPGSVEDGVEFLKSYDIVVHPDCKHTSDELTLYSYEVDKLTGDVLPKKLEPEMLRSK